MEMAKYMENSVDDFVLFFFFVFMKSVFQGIGYPFWLKSRCLENTL